ncbi:MAG: penicillin-binding protein 2 [Actinomycetota bacterium]
MVTNGQNGKTSLGIDRTKLRLAVLGVLVISIFVALFSRLWFLQVLAVGEYRVLAKENRVRLVHSEPFRGLIVDRNGKVLVENRNSLAVAIDRQLIDEPREIRRTLRKISKLIGVDKKILRENLNDVAASPYKPVPVAYDIAEEQKAHIDENQEKYPGVNIIDAPIRKYPRGELAAHILGYVNEISETQLESDHFKGAKPAYLAGDVVGQSGIEYIYDRFLRGKPLVEKVVVNSAGERVGSDTVREGEEGKDLVLSLDLGIQSATENALKNGIDAARNAGYIASSGGAVVMDPDNGEIISMASFPTYKPAMLADGITHKEFASLSGSPDTNEDDALLNRPIQGTFPSGSTFKVVTAGAALALDVVGPYTYIDCPGVRTYGNIDFRNWTSANFGAISFPKSLEISCDTFYYELGWRMENLWGAANGDGTEKFQDYVRTAGFGQETGIDLPNEADGVVPDRRWCIRNQRQIDPNWCAGYEWLPGYTVNMSIGQGDMIGTPLQMAVTYAAIANGGRVVQPRLGMGVRRVDEDGTEDMVRKFKPKTLRKLPLDDSELGVIQEGLEDVLGGASGTGRSAFAGFPLDRFPLAGKTGTAQIGAADSGLNYAWFISYGPLPDPEYVIAVYLQKAGHGGESAAPVARQIWEVIFDIDKKTDVTLGQDASG